MRYIITLIISIVFLNFFCVYIDNNQARVLYACLLWILFVRLLVTCLWVSSPVHSSKHHGASASLPQVFFFPRNRIHAHGLSQGLIQRWMFRFYLEILVCLAHSIHSTILLARDSQHGFGFSVMHGSKKGRIVPAFTGQLNSISIRVWIILVHTPVVAPEKPEKLDRGVHCHRQVGKL